MRSKHRNRPRDLSVGFPEPLSEERAPLKGTLSKGLRSHNLLQVNGTPTTLWMLSRFAICLTANAAQPLLLDYLSTQGGATWSTFIYILPTYYAMVFLLLVERKKSIWQEDWRCAALLSICDLIHQLIEKIGLLYAGSAVYIVASSSTTAWLAIFSLLLGKHIPPLRLCALAAICCGILLRGFGSRAFSVSAAALEPAQIFGAGLTVLAAAIHSLFYIFNEAYMTGEKAVEGPNLVAMMGIISSSILSLWVLLYTVPRWNLLVAQPIAAHGGTYPAICSALLALLACSMLRAFTLWALIKHGGAVLSGLLKGARLSLVMVANHWLFCPQRIQTCMNVVSTAAATLCAGGVILYSISPPTKNGQPDGQPAGQHAGQSTGGTAGGTAGKGPRRPST